MFLKGNKDKYFNTATTLIFAIIVIKDNCYYFSGFYLGKKFKNILENHLEFWIPQGDIGLCFIIL